MDGKLAGNAASHGYRGALSYPTYVEAHKSIAAPAIGTKRPAELERRPRRAGANDWGQWLLAKAEREQRSTGCQCRDEEGCHQRFRHDLT